MRELVILGASGLAREVYDLANQCFGKDPQFRIKGFLSDNPSDIEELGYPPVLGRIDEYSVQPDDVFFCGIGDVYSKKNTTEIILSKGGRFISLIHPAAIISPSSRIGEGVAVKAFCVISSNVVIEGHSYLQSSVIAGHDVHIGKYCQINSFSFFAGYVRIHDQVTVNAGARFVQNAVAEEQSVVGMGSVVLRRVKKGTTVYGNPAKVLHYK
ncbi:MAG TPA: NeuD/PglB/VioB family sugar acetyltransferase [Bacteroidales bacterium]|jgi:sugar O-acyltransferase (sialic acid O-acetyltransferase NeuD family)|nr:NeuD/PglB/VioB family sugar acetyltransferase [Bacteroidales bacterium]